MHYKYLCNKILSNYSYYEENSKSYSEKICMIYITKYENIYSRYYFENVCIY